MKIRSLIFSLGAISATAITTTVAIGLTSISPLKFDPIAALAASVVAFFGIVWFRKTSGKN
jgi:hypothetical protein